MELRKDPITRSGVIVGDEREKHAPEGRCPFCPGATNAPQVIGWLPPGEHGAGPVRAGVHPAALYRVEGEPQRRSEGIYDVMNTVGAHEVLVQSIRHDIELWQSSDAEISQFLLLAAHRIQDLKRDLRFKYVTLFKNHGTSAGQEFDHPIAQLTATTFVPRRVLYDSRAARDYYADKERCVFCDSLNQEMRTGERIVEAGTDYVSACPFPPRVPHATRRVPPRPQRPFQQPRSYEK